MDYHLDYDGEILLDEHGDPIPVTACICHARNDFECCCGAWDLDWEEDEDD